MASARALKIVVIFYLVVSSALLWFSLRNPTTAQEFVVYQLVQAITAVAIWVVQFVRTSKQFYLPALAEMDDLLYFQRALLFFLAIKALARSLLSGSIAGLQDYDNALVVSMTLFLAVSLQRRTWAQPHIVRREKRILELYEKANLSKKEREAIENRLIERTAKRQRKPMIWNAFSFILMVVIFGSMLNSYASSIADTLQPYLPSQDILPPYQQ